MPNPEVHYPAAADLTQQFNSIVDVESNHPTEVTPAAPVAGELQHVKTFAPEDLPEGVLLIPQDTTNPRLPHIGEASPEDLAQGNVGQISVDPNSKGFKMLNIRDPQGNRHRVFLSREGMKVGEVVQWFVVNKGYVVGPADFDTPDAAPRHALREPSTDTAAEPAAAPQEPERHWFEAFQPAPYPETDKAVTGSHYPSIRKALAGESAVDEVTVPSPAPAVEAAPDKPEPGDWREAAQEKFADQPLPLGEQLHGVKAAMLAVGPLLSRNYFLAPEQVATALEEVDDYSRWQAIFPDHTAYATKPKFKPFSRETAGIIQHALEEVVRSAPQSEALATLTDRPRHELTPAENARLDTMRSLERLAPVAKAIQENPTILSYSEFEQTKPAMEPVSENDMPKGPPNNTLVLPVDRFAHFNGLQPTTVIKPPVVHRVRNWATQKSAQFVSFVSSKLRGRGKRQIANA